jgi:hypothetical protein
LQLLIRHFSFAEFSSYFFFPQEKVTKDYEFPLSFGSKRKWRKKTAAQARAG